MPYRSRQPMKRKVEIMLDRSELAEIFVNSGAVSDLTHFGVHPDDIAIDENYRTGAERTESQAYSGTG